MGCPAATRCCTAVLFVFTLVLTLMAVAAYLVPVKINDRFYKPHGEELDLDSEKELIVTGVATPHVKWYYYWPPTRAAPMRSVFDPLALFAAAVNVTPTSTVKVIMHSISANNRTTYNLTDIAEGMEVAHKALNWPANGGCTPNTVQIGVYSEVEEKYALHIWRATTATEWCDMAPLANILLLPFALLVLGAVVLAIVSISCLVCLCRDKDKHSYTSIHDPHYPKMNPTMA